jgi:hypothetical protein
MTRFLTSADKYRDPRDFSGGYRFGKSAGGRRRAATTLARVAGYLKAVIEAIADSKMRSTSVPIDLLRSAVGALVKFLGPLSDGPVSKYHPEKHYMRGPGPKWHEKHFLHRASAGS